MTPEINTLAIALLIIFLLLWNLDFIATLLNLKSLRPELPAEFRDTLDAEKYAKSQDYTRASSRYHLITATWSLTLLLVFWWMGGFGWIDTHSRALGGSILIIGLIYIGVLYTGNYLLNPPLRNLRHLRSRGTLRLQQDHQGHLHRRPNQIPHPHRPHRDPPHRRHPLDL